MSFVEDALKFHAEHNGMLAVASKVPLNNREDLALAYTPALPNPAKPLRKIRNFRLNIPAAATLLPL